MSTVHLVIAGLALCNKSSTGAESLFFHPNSHSLVLKIKANGAITPPVSLGTQNTIQVTLNNATAFVPSGALPFKQIVDFDELHGRTLCLATPPMWTMSYWTVPSASLYTFKQDPKTYELWEKAGTIRTLKDPALKVGEKVGMSYQVNTGGSVVVTVMNPAGITETFTFAAGEDYEVEFDNTCTAASCGSDYPLYYEMLEQTAVQFEILLPTDTGDSICNVGSGGKCANVFDYFQSHNSQNLGAN